MSIMAVTAAATSIKVEYGQTKTTKQQSMLQPIYTTQTHTHKAHRPGC